MESRMPPFATPSTMRSPSSISNPRRPAQGPCDRTDQAGSLLEIICLELADEVILLIHAMPLRPTFYDLLPQTREDMP